MQRLPLNDLSAFLIVAEERSFTRAAARLGVSQSALSHTINTLEQRLGLRLLTRTTRSVAVTEAGERLCLSVGPKLAGIEADLTALTALRDKPAGTIRITVAEHAANTVLWPVLDSLLPEYPDIHVEVMIEAVLRDIVAERFDAGIRLGEAVDRDMIAIPLSPPLKMAVVGSASYFAVHPAPHTPQDLTGHRCINLRMPTSGGLYAWEFEKNGRSLRVRVDGSLTVNNSALARRACLAGHGLAYVLADTVAPAIADGSLIQVLEDWCQPFSGYHLYYPGRRQPTPAFSVLLNALRRRAPSPP
ncbi:LysR family transcriptional regulator [Novispirillum itersonii]|uniref:LysR family transcriptional regulator n=1 Tax=Novispirillum itersonii TaxID=189 RepID=UPI000368047E|nr:LysR family transcriptional regulator [Novispirillum itersonii]